jgi:hypothetical protein
MGGLTPCYSSLLSTRSPPSLPELTNLNPESLITATSTNISTSTTSTSTSKKPTSAIVNIVYAMPYPAKKHLPGLAQGTKIGISVGSSVAGLVIGLLAILLLLGSRKRKKDQQMIKALKGVEPVSNFNGSASDNTTSRNSMVVSDISHTGSMGRHELQMNQAIAPVRPAPAGTQHVQSRHEVSGQHGYAGVARPELAGASMPMRYELSEERSYRPVLA